MSRACRALAILTVVLTSACAREELESGDECQLPPAEGRPTRYAVVRDRAPLHRRPADDALTDLILAPGCAGAAVMIAEEDDGGPWLRVRAALGEEECRESVASLTAMDLLFSCGAPISCR